MPADQVNLEGEKLDLQEDQETRTYRIIKASYFLIKVSDASLKGLKEAKKDETKSERKERVHVWTAKSARLFGKGFRPLGPGRRTSSGYIIGSWRGDNGRCP